MKQPNESNDAIEPEKLLPITTQMAQMINDGQRLLTYIAKHGDIELDTGLSQNIINAKLALDKGQWSVAEESGFLADYDKLATHVYPVTVESINAVIPKDKGIKREPTRAERAVAWYRRYTLVALILMLAAQLYWLVGNNLRLNLQEKFEQREVTRDQIRKINGASAEKDKLEQALKVQNQEFDANFRLIQTWNKVWLFGGAFGEALPSFLQASFEQQEKQAQAANDEAKLGDLALNRKEYEVRIVYFENILSADFMLDAFQSYILPLLYGLLGAFIYVLRCLMGDIKSLTYTFDSEIRYRLRLTLGALGGMIIGWFLKPDDAGSMASLSPMALAFLMGYNVDVLFALMDKIIDNIKQSIDKPPPKPQAEKK